MSLGLTDGIVVVTFAAVGGIWGWRRETRRLYQRSPYGHRPDSMSPAEYERWIIGNGERWIIASGKRWRLLRTALFAAASALSGCIILLVIAPRR